jgi:hypothetical protein
MRKDTFTGFRMVVLMGRPSGSFSASLYGKLGGVAI